MDCSLSKKIKKCAIIQSSYIPWRGYFDIINSVDEFILLDDTQYTKRDWRNRNKIKCATGLQWLTIPVYVKGRFSQHINDVVVCDSRWAKQHWRAIELCYGKANFFTSLADKLYWLYWEVQKLKKLSEINYLTISSLCQWLNIHTKLSYSTDYQIKSDEKNDKLIQLCLASESHSYLSGPSAKTYLQIDQFKQTGISVEYMNYEDYPVYPQRFHSFEPFVSILDLLCNVGLEEAPTFMKSFKK